MFDEYVIDPNTLNLKGGFTFRMKKPPANNRGFFTKNRRGIYSRSQLTRGSYALIASDPMVSLYVDPFSMAREYVVDWGGLTHSTITTTQAMNGFHHTVTSLPNIPPTWQSGNWSGSKSVTIETYRDMQTYSTLAGDTFSIPGDWTYEVKSDTALPGKRATQRQAWSGTVILDEGETLSF